FTVAEAYHVERCGHLHIAIGWKKKSRFYEDPTKHMNDFVREVKRRFSWMDFCSSLANEDTQFLIQNKRAVGNYMSKPEIGMINGACFSKQPLWSENLPHLPSDQDLVLEPLGAI
ncbi:hypothetical protein N9999_02410, partial [bacterium]|nr:hypothetical protein [bacterium]